MGGQHSRDQPSARVIKAGHRIKRRVLILIGESLILFAYRPTYIVVI